MKQMCLPGCPPRWWSLWRAHHWRWSSPRSWPWWPGTSRPLSWPPCPAPPPCQSSDQSPADSRLPGAGIRDRLVDPHLKTITCVLYPIHLVLGPVIVLCPLITFIPVWIWLFQVWSEMVTNIAGKLSSDHEASLFEITPDQAVKLLVTPLFAASSINPSIPSRGGRGYKRGLLSGCCSFWFSIFYQLSDILRC